MSLSMMQLLSVLFKCKLYYLLNYYFRIFKLSVEWQFLDTYFMSIYSYFIFLIIKIYQNHIIMGIIFSHSIAEMNP